MVEDGSGAAGSTRGPEAALQLAWVDPDTATQAELLDLLDLLDLVQRHAGWVASVEASILAALHDRMVGSQDDKEFLSDEVGLVMHLPSGYGRDQMQTGADLVRRLPQTHALLAAGVVRPAQARLLAEKVFTLTDQQCTDVEARVLVRAADQTTGQFRRSLDRAVLAAAPTTAEQAHERAVADRFVRIDAAPDGMATLFALLPAPEAMRVKTAIWRLAQHNRAAATDAAESDECPVVVEGVNAYRADALVQLADRFLTESDPTGVINRQSPLVQVVVSVETLTRDSDEPAELLGHGPIPAGLARRIAADPSSTWQRLVTDPMGVLIDYGHTRYRPPKHLADHIRANHRTCTYPNCTRPAINCDLDHATDWDHGGETNQANLIPACSRHHHLKHDANWKIKYDSTTGQVTWISPTGRTYRNPRPDY